MIHSCSSECASHVCCPCGTHERWIIIEFPNVQFNAHLVPSVLYVRYMSARVLEVDDDV